MRLTVALYLWVKEKKNINDVESDIEEEGVKSYRITWDIVGTDAANICSSTNGERNITLIRSKQLIKRGEHQLLMATTN